MMSLCKLLFRNKRNIIAFGFHSSAKYTEVCHNPSKRCPQKAIMLPVTLKFLNPAAQQEDFR